MRKSLLPILLLSILTTGFAQRPKVGLALSGGAAKGFAHIGVLRAFEEAGLMPDYITGTSMGSIMGGLYAIGYSADSLERLSISQDWDLMLSDRVPLHEVIFEEKPFFRNQLVEVPFREGKLEAPIGLIHGQQIDELLTRMTLPVYRTFDFDELPIPFHCIAADVVSGRPVELAEGSLAQAMRASMAIPTIFTPVEKDSMVLVDGGLLRNFPVEELRQMGADIIIGVYVGAQSKDAEKLRSFSKILTQIAFLTSIQDAEEQMQLIDIYIEPELGEYGPADFKNADTIITMGYRAAMAQFEELQHLADSLDALGPGPGRPQLNAMPLIHIDRIQVTGNYLLSDAEVIDWSGLLAGQTVSPEDLQNALEKLFGTNYYEKVRYEIKRRGHMNVLTFHCREKAPNLLKGSLIYDSYHEAGIAFNITMRNALLPASRLMFVGILANNYRYRLSYLKYLGQNQEWFLETLFQLNRDGIPVIQEGRVTEQFIQQEFPIDLRLHHRLGSNMLLGLGGRFEFLSLRPSISEFPLFEKLDYSNFILSGSFQLNTLNRNILPTRGSRLQVGVDFVSNLDYQLDTPSDELGDPDSLFSFNPYPKVTVQLESFLPVGRRSLIRVSPFTGILWSAENAFSDYYLVGAPEDISRRSVPFTGLDANELVAQVALGSGLSYQYFLRDNLMLGLDIRAGLFAEPEILADGIPIPDSFILGAGLTAAYNSLVGPFKIHVMHPVVSFESIQDDLKVFLTFGHRF